MPSKYRIRNFIPGGYYHVFNRGTARATIFHDPQDYEVFIHFLRGAVTQPFESTRRKNFHDSIRILSFVLMPNHFHIQLQQIHERALAVFMSSLTIAYSMYYNKKYQRTGSLFQGKYQSINIQTDQYLLHLSRYIHLNPQAIGKDPHYYLYSSIGAYCNRSLSWIYTQPIDELLGVNNEIDQALKYKDFLAASDDFHLLEKQDPFL